MKLRNSDRAALLDANDTYEMVKPFFDAVDEEFGPGASLRLLKSDCFAKAFVGVQVAQHWKSWRFGVRAGRMRAATPVTELLHPKLFETLAMVGVIGSVFASIMRAGRKGVAAPEPHEQAAGAVQS